MRKNILILVFVAFLCNIFSAFSQNNDIKRYDSAIKLLLKNMESHNYKAIQKSHQILWKSGNHEMLYAWEVTNLDGRKVIYHFGGTYGFTSYFGFIEGSKTGVIVLTNTKVRMNELAINILRKLALDLPKKK